MSYKCLPKSYRFRHTNSPKTKKKGFSSYRMKQSKSKKLNRSLGDQGDTAVLKFVLPRYLRLFQIGWQAPNIAITSVQKLQNATQPKLPGLGGLAEVPPMLLANCKKMGAKKGFNSFGRNTMHRRPQVQVLR